MHHRFSGHELGQTLGDGEEEGRRVLQSMGSQRVRRDLVIEQTIIIFIIQFR